MLEDQSGDEIINLGPIAAIDDVVFAGVGAVIAVVVKDTLSWVNRTSQTSTECDVRSR